MRIIVFSHNYPPKRNPRSFRIRNLEQSGFFGRDYLIFSNFKLVSSQFVNLHNESNQKKWKFKKSNFLSNLKNVIQNNSFSNFLSKCIIPDRFIFLQIYYLLFYLFRYRKKDDLIYTVSNPFSSHLIGIVLQKYFKHEWHADIGDVYFSPMTSNWCIHQTIERKVLVSANRIILNSESIRNHFIKVYSINNEKTQLVPNGVNIKFENSKPISSPILRFSFIGNTYHPVRPAILEVEFILKYFNLHPERPMLLQLYGNQIPELIKLATRNPLQFKISTCHSDLDLLEAYSKTDILINFANVNNPGLPSKLDEYIASGIPIINFYKTSEDTTLTYLNSVNALHLDVNTDFVDEETYLKLNQFISNYVS